MEIESVTLAGVLPGVIVADENIAVAPVGRPDAVNVTGLENARSAKLSDRNWRVGRR